MRRRPLIAGLVAGLAGCGEGTWLGESEPPPLEGTRLPVLLAGEGAMADPRLAELRVALPPATLNADWPQYAGEPDNAMGHPVGPASASLAWRRSIGRGAAGSARLLGRPVVAAGQVYAVDGAGVVTATAAGDGSRLWSWQTREGRLDDRLAGGAVATAGGVVFAALAHGEVVALPAAGGEPIWRVALRAPLRAAPAIAAGLVLLRTADNQLLAFDAATGQLRWRHAGAVEPAALMGGAPPAVLGNVCVVAYTSGEVVALALDSGRPIWTESVVRPRRTLALGAILDIAGAPVIDRGRVIVAGNGGEVAALDLRRGERLWDVPIGSRGTPWVAGEFVFVVSDRGELVCLLRQGGRVRWVSALRAAEGDGAASAFWAGPVLASERLWVVGSSGELLALSPYTGELIERTRLGGRASQPPVVAGGTLFVLTDTGELAAFR